MLVHMAVVGAGHDYRSEALSEEVQDQARTPQRYPDNARGRRSGKMTMRRLSEIDQLGDR